jgi:hypothetical protein
MIRRVAWCLFDTTVRTIAARSYFPTVDTLHRMSDVTSVPYGLKIGSEGILVAMRSPVPYPTSLLRGILTRKTVSSAPELTLIAPPWAAATSLAM